MPVINQKDVLNNLKIRDEDVQVPENIEKEEVDVPFTDTVAASFRKFNLIGSIVANGLPDFSIDDRNYDLKSKLVEYGLESRALEFSRVDNDEEFFGKIDQLEQEETDNEILANSGWTGVVTSLAAGILDPTFLIPATGILKAGRLVNTLRGAASGAALTFASEGVRSSILAQNQADLGTEDVVFDSIAGAFLGGVMGTGIGLMTRTSRIAAKAHIKNVFKDKPLKYKINEDGSVSVPEATDTSPVTAVERVPRAAPGSAGSAETLGPILDGEGIAKLNTTFVRVVSNPIGIIRSPTVEGLTRRSPLQQKLTSSLFEHVFELKKNKLGEGTSDSAESLIELDSAKITILNSNVQKLYMESIGIKNGVFKQARSLIKSKRDGTVTSWSEFNEEIAKAARRGDKSDNPFVQKAAELRRIETDKAFAGMKKFGVMDKDADVGDTAVSHFTRMYDSDKILADRQGFKEIFTKAFRRDNPTKSAEWVDDQVEETIATILGRGDQALGLSDVAARTVVRSAKFTKSRTVNIPDSELEKFLVNDAMQVTNQYLSTASALTRFNQVIQKMGFESVVDLKKALLKELDDSVKRSVPRTREVKGLQDVLDNPKLLTAKELRAAVQAELKNIPDKLKKPKSSLKTFIDNAGKDVEDVLEFKRSLQDGLNIHAAVNPKELNKLNKDFEKDLTIMDENIAIVLGQYRTKALNSRFQGFDNSLKNVRKYNTLVILGGMVISAIADVAMPLFRHGTLRTLRDGYLPRLRNFAATKASRDEFKDFGIGLEMENNELVKMITDPDYTPGTGRSVFDNTMDAALKSFGKLTLMDYWNYAGRRMAAHMASARIIRNVLKVEDGGKLSPKEVTRMASIGIGKDQYAGIAKQFRLHGTEVDGSFIANFEKWDVDIRDSFGATLRRDVNATIILPSKGDIPKIGQGSEIGKTAFQISSFQSAATNKILLSAIQRRDATAAFGIMALITSGMLVATIKNKLAGREQPDTFLELFVDGLSRSGAAGRLGDAILALNPAYTANRYIGKSISSIALGPSVGLVEKVTAAGLGVATNLREDEELSQADITRVRRLLPFQNLFYLDAVLKEVYDDEE